MGMVVDKVFAHLRPQLHKVCTFIFCGFSRMARPKKKTLNKAVGDLHDTHNSNIFSTSDPQQPSVWYGKEQFCFAKMALDATETCGIYPSSRYICRL